MNSEMAVEPVTPTDNFRFCPRCGTPGFANNNFKSRRCGNCGFVFYFNPSAATACFIRDCHGNVLITRRAKEPAKGTLDLPGGFVDNGETGEQAILREIREETGLDIGKARYLFSIPNIYTYSGLDVHTLDMIFEAGPVDVAGAAPADDVEELIPIPVSSLDPSQFGLTSIRRAVEKYILLHSQSKPEE